MSLTRGRQGYKSGGTADTMLSNGERRPRATSPAALPVPGSARYPFVMFLGCAGVGRKRTLVQRDLISAQIAEQTSLINPRSFADHSVLSPPI